MANVRFISGLVILAPKLVWRQTHFSATVGTERIDPLHPLTTSTVNGPIDPIAVVRDVSLQSVLSEFRSYSSMLYCLLAPRQPWMARVLFFSGTSADE